MKKLIPITLAFLVTCLTTTAMAEQGGSRGSREGYTSQGKRIERHLDARGDRIEQRFDQKAARAAEQGKYRQASRFAHKGQQIDRHLDRKGQRIHHRIDHRRDVRREAHHPPPHRLVVYPAYGHVRQGNFTSLVIRQPGLWFSWGMHN